MCRGICCSICFTAPPLLRTLLLLTAILRTCQRSSAPMTLSTALSCTAPLTKGTRRNFQRKMQRRLLCLRVRLIVWGEDVSHGHSERCRDDRVMVSFSEGFSTAVATSAAAAADNSGN